MSHLWRAGWSLPLGSEKAAECPSSLSLGCSFIATWCFAYFFFLIWNWNRKSMVSLTMVSLLNIIFYYLFSATKIFCYRRSLPPLPSVCHWPPFTWNEGPCLELESPLVWVLRMGSGGPDMLMYSCNFQGWEPGWKPRGLWTDASHAGPTWLSSYSQVLTWSGGRDTVIHSARAEILT